MAQSTELLIARNKGEKVLADSQVIRTMGFARTLTENPGVPGPTLVFEEGDSAVIDLWNVSQGAPHTIHLHGLDVNQENDGVPHLSFSVHHMDHGYYRFKVPHPGTYLYHCHVVSTLHVQGGMYGVLIVYPKGSRNLTWENGYRYERDYSILTSEIDPIWHSDSVMILSHDSAHQRVKIPKYRPTHFLINGYSDHQIDQELGLYEIKKDSNTFFRFSNVGFTGNTVYFPKNMDIQIVSSDGRPLPVALHQDSINIYPGERYGVIVKSNELSQDSIVIHYFDLNNLKLLNKQRVMVQTRAVSALETIDNIAILVYPNPNNGLIRIQSTYSGKADLLLYTIQGIEVDSETIHVNGAFEWKLQEGIPPGTYILEFRTSKGLIRKTVQKY
ncbi:multicopper oxidase domain-containing protein [bacterium]|nr:multicopper oxidase domain-containing protein [bacterium]